MTPWQRRARFSIGVFSMVFAVVVGVALRRHRPAPPTPPAVVRTDPDAVVESTKGRVERFRLSREDVRIEYGKQLTYATGATKMQDLTVTTDDRGGRSFTMKGREGEVGENESVIALRGDVSLVASDGLKVRTPEASYGSLDGVVRAPGSVDFDRGRLRGSGVGMTYDREHDVLWVLDRAAVHLEGDHRGVGAVHVQSGSAGVMRHDRLLQFDRGVQVQRGGQLIEATSAVGYLSADEQRMERLQLHEQGRVGVPKASPGALRSLSARDMDLYYKPDGETLDRAVLVGEARIVLAGQSGTPGRQFASDSIDVTFTADGTAPSALSGRGAVVLKLPAEPGTSGRTIQADSVDVSSGPTGGLTFAHFEGRAKIAIPHAAAGALQSLAGRTMDLRYRPDGETLEHVVIAGAALVSVAGAAGAPGREIGAETIDIALAPDGVTPLKLTGRESVQLLLPAEGGAPARTITSRTLDASGEAGRGLTRAGFAGDARFHEAGGTVDRTASAAALDVGLKPGMAGLDEARFTHGVRFTDGRMTALAAAARYDLDRGTLDLSGSEPGATVPRVVNDQLTVDAARVGVTLAGPKMRAVGAVKSVLQPGRKQTGLEGSASPRLPGMLKPGEAVNATAAALDYDGTTSKAIYTGAALLWQGDTSIRGATITLDDRTGDLAADGAVTTTTMLDEVDKNRKRQRVRTMTTGRTFRYEEATRKATYSGNAHMVGSTGDMTASSIELFLKSSGNELERAEAYESVVLRDRNRKTSGDRLTYTTADERYLVVGAPVRILDECARETTGKTLTYFKTADTIVVDGNAQARTETKGGGTCR